MDAGGGNGRRRDRRVVFGQWTSGNGACRIGVGCRLLRLTRPTRPSAPLRPIPRDPHTCRSASGAAEPHPCSPTSHECVSVEAEAIRRPPATSGDLAI